MLQSLADVACSSGVVYRASWLRIAQPYLSCASVRGRGILFRHCDQSMAVTFDKGAKYKFSGASVKTERKEHSIQPTIQPSQY